MVALFWHQPPGSHISVELYGKDLLVKRHVIFLFLTDRKFTIGGAHMMKYVSSKELLSRSSFCQTDRFTFGT